MRGGHDHKSSVAAAQKMILLMATHWKVVLGIIEIIIPSKIIPGDCDIVLIRSFWKIRWWMIFSS